MIARILVVLALLPAAAMACPEAAVVDALIADRAAARPVRLPVAPGGGLAAARCAQAMLVERLIPTLGPVIGYKAGLTSPQAQAAFGVTEPVMGTLLAGMILADGARVSATDRVRPLVEADLVVEIADAAVAEATTPEGVLRHVRGVRPFIELPALLVGPDVKLDGPAITAINVGASRGVMGDLIRVPPGAEGVAMLADFTALLTDGAGAELSAVPGRAVLGHPLNAVIWIARQLAAEGKALAPGDLVSVGSLGPLHPAKPGMTVTLAYVGLPGTPRLSVTFE